MEIQTYSPGQVPEDMLPPVQSVQSAPSSQPPAPAPYTRQPRRVGTVTLGVTLILLGILIPLALFLGENMWRLLQLAPVVLLCLGVEILVYSIRYKHDRFKYDGLSIFLVVLITFSTLLGAMLAPPLLNASAYAKKMDSVYMEVQQTAEDALAAASCTGDVCAYEGGRSWTAVFQDPDEVQRLPMYLEITLLTVDGSQAPSREQITAAFASVAAACGRNDNIESLHLSMKTKEPQGSIAYSADLTGGNIRNASISDMEARLRAEEILPSSTTTKNSGLATGYEDV